AVTSHIRNLDGAGGPYALRQLEVAIIDHTNQTFLVVRFHFDDRVIVLLYPQISVGVLRRFARLGLQLPTVFFIGDDLVVELRHIALFQILEAEVGSEETRGTILQRNALLAPDIWTPQPLIA